MRISDWSSDVCSSDLRILALTVHGGEVELGLYLDTHRRHRAAGRRLAIFRRVEHRLRRDAADVEAGAAQRLAPFGARGLAAQLRRADRRGPPPGAGPDGHGDVIHTIGRAA